MFKYILSLVLVSSVAFAQGGPHGSDVVAPKAAVVKPAKKEVKKAVKPAKKEVKKAAVKPEVKKPEVKK